MVSPLENAGLADEIGAMIDPGERAGAALISVVITFADAERFLQEAIDSVFEQSYGNWELLLIDDGSADHSGEIARKAVDRRPGGVVCLEHAGHDHLGRSASRNLGIQNARGQFVAFLDTADVWLPRKLERELALLRVWPGVGMVYGTTEAWYSWTGDPLDANRDLAPDLGVILGVPLEGPVFLSGLVARQVSAPAVSSLLIRREIAQGVAGFEPALRPPYDAHAFVAKVCLASSLLASGECWDRVRQGPVPGGSGGEAAPQEPSARRFFLEWLEAYLLATGFRHGLVWQSLRNELNALRAPRTPAAAGSVRRVARRMVPAFLRRRLGSVQRNDLSVPAVGHVQFGSLRRLTPISRQWGRDRGALPIDRYYVERFLAEHASDVRGRVLEVGDDAYTRQFGGGAVARRDVLHARPGNPKATIVADLARGGDRIPAAAFDCMILTQVLHVIADPGAAVRTIHVALRPGGVVLATLPGISQVSRWDVERWGDYWRFTTLAARRLFASIFPPDLVSVAAYGNVLAAIGFLHGLAAEELRREELDSHDPDYQVVIAVRAVRPAS